MNPYTILGVSVDADAATIKAAYRRAAASTHPDTSDDPRAADRFIELRQAYELLADPVRRALYDKGPEGPTPARADTCAYLDLHLPFVLVARGGVAPLTVDLEGRPVFSISVAVPAGIGVGYIWRLKAGTPPVELVITLRSITPSSVWRQESPKFGVGRDIHGPLRLGLATLLLGGQVSVDAPSGPLMVRLVPRSLDPIRVAGKGLWGGDLVLHIEVVWPRPDAHLLAELRRHTHLS